MTVESLLPQLLGPLGALLLALSIAFFQKREIDQWHSDLRTGQLVPREYYDRALTQLDAALALSDKAVDTSAATSRAIEERNRLERERLSRQRASVGLSSDLEAAQDRVTRVPRK